MLQLFFLMFHTLFLGHHFQIAGFYVSYEDFYKSFKLRGEINNLVMTLWSYQFNIDQAEARAQDTTLIKKYAFSAVLRVSFHPILFSYLRLAFFSPFFASFFLQWLVSGQAQDWPFQLLARFMYKGVAEAQQHVELCQAWPGIMLLGLLVMLYINFSASYSVVLDLFIIRANFASFFLFVFQLFFPLVVEKHWVLICINLFLKQIFWFNPIKGTTDTPCYESANALVSFFFVSFFHVMTPCYQTRTF